MENIDEVLLCVAHDREGVAWGWSTVIGWARDIAPNPLQ